MRDIECINCEQGSEEWHRARAGCITASKVKDIRDRLKSGPNKGDFNKATQDLAFKLAIERITGDPIDDDEFSPWQAARGQRLEPEARALHEVQAGVMVMPMGFIRTIDGKFGASVDGLIGDREGAEYKAFLSPSKLRRIIVDDDWSDVIDQCQFSLAVTGRDLWHMGLYCPQLDGIGRALTLRTVGRDEAYIDAMWRDLMEFDRLVEQFRATLEGKKAPPPPWVAVVEPGIQQRQDSTKKAAPLGVPSF
jgi:hypothetical protein